MACSKNIFPKIPSIVGPLKIPFQVFFIFFILIAVLELCFTCGNIPVNDKVKWFNNTQKSARNKTNENKRQKYIYIYSKKDPTHKETFFFITWRGLEYLYSIAKRNRKGIEKFSPFIFSPPSYSSTNPTQNMFGD